jgi:ADP-ribosylglycohydrolase
MNSAIAEAPDQESLQRALEASELSGVAAGDTFGRTCYLQEAMPVSFHILNTARSYAEAIRANIHCGGDSCGRAWLIGPAMAAIQGVGGKNGIPLSWLAQVTDAPTVYRDIESLLSV